MQLSKNIFSWQIEGLHGYGFFHLFFILLTVIMAILLIKKGKNDDEKQIRKVVFSFGIFFLVLEVYKQLFYTLLEKASSYPWYIFPFQLCSTPLYLCLIIPIFSDATLRKKMYTYLAFYGLLAGFSVLIYPETVIISEVTISIQSLLWHGGMVVLGCYLIQANSFGQRKEELRPAILIFFILTMLAQTMNIAFEQLKQLYQLQGTFNMFFISPYYTQGIPVLSQITEETNWFVSFIIYIIGVTLGACLVWTLAHLKYVKKEEKVEE